MQHLSVKKLRFNIFTHRNQNLIFEQQQNAFLHALKHIMGDDFNKDDVEKIEIEAHQA